jgi:hypothetical protein
MGEWSGGENGMEDWRIGGMEWWRDGVVEGWLMVDS